MAPCEGGLISEQCEKRGGVWPHLYAPPTSRDEGLNGGGVVPTCKLLFLRLLPGNNGYSQELFIDTSIEIQDSQYLCSVCVRVCVCYIKPQSKMQLRYLNTNHMYTHTHTHTHMYIHTCTHTHIHTHTHTSSSASAFFS